MRPMGWPASSRSRTSKQMCHPAAPHEMKRRSILCQSVRRVPLPNGSSSHRMSPYSSTSGASARVTLVLIGVEGRPLAELCRLGQRLPDFFRWVTQFSRENQRPFLSILSDLRPAGRTRHVLVVIGHLLLLTSAWIWKPLFARLDEYGIHLSPVRDPAAHPPYQRMSCVI